MMEILHLSDLHLSAPGILHYGKVDTTAVLVQLMAEIPRHWAPDVVVVSGDISNDDSSHSYEAALDIVGSYADHRGIEVAWVPGNHDNNREVDRLHHPGNGHHLTGALSVGEDRVVLIDSRVPGRGFGRLPSTTVGLNSFGPTSGQRVLVVHHPPLPAPSALHHALRLRGLERWEDEVRHAEVSLVLSGHYHLAGRGTWAGADVVVAPAVANRTLVSDWQREQAVTAHGVSLVRTGEALQVEEISIGDGQTMVLDLAADLVSQVAHAAGDPDEPGGGLDTSETARLAGHMWHRSPRQGRTKADQG